jgi:hypothetical protein
MNISQSIESLGLLERLELKFHIPETMVEPISNFASIYCSPDKYSRDAEGGVYTVNSLYLDSPNYLFLRRRLDGSANRVNMRVRSYGDTGELPFFLEIKQKKVRIVRKFRVSVQDSTWHHVLEEPGAEALRDSDIEGPRNHLDLFLRLAQTYQAEPKVLLQYKRRAYVSQVDDYARVTFDTDLKYCPPTGYRPCAEAASLIPCDHAAVFDPGCSVILELKCYASQVPLWMVDLIRGFDLLRRRFSKYVTAVGEVFQQHKPGSLGRQHTVRIG